MLLLFCCIFRAIVIMKRDRVIISILCGFFNVLEQKLKGQAVKMDCYYYKGPK